MTHVRNARGCACALAVSLAVCLSAAGAAASASEPASAPATTRAASQPAWSDHTGRALANFAALMGNSWKQIAFFAATTVLSAVMWALLWVLAGVAAGLVAWMVVRRFRLLDAPWSWYRWVRWLWCAVFVISFAAGAAYAGAWFGVGRNVKHYIRERRMLDKVVSHLVLAAMLDRADYDANGQESAERVQAVLADSDAVSQLAIRDWAAMSEQAARRAGGGFLGPWLVRLAGGDAVDKLARELRGMDVRLVVVLFLTHPNIDDYLAKYPNAQPGVIALAGHFRAIRQGACDLVDALVRPHVRAAAALGLGIAFGAVLLFRLVVCLISPRRRGVSGAGQAE